MLNPLAAENYKPHFTGHETFPLRHGWLKKAYDAVNEAIDNEGEKSPFLRDDAISRFGVGKNMVMAIRHWAMCAKVIEDTSGTVGHDTTSLAETLFGDHGLDRYAENQSTLWLIHWLISSNPERTTWFWTFNVFIGAAFERDQLVQGIAKLAASQSWPRASETTIKRDVECFLRTYVSKSNTGNASLEDTLECPLAELGLIEATGKRDGFRFVRGPKPSLHDGVFLFALIDFWTKHTSAETLSADVIAHHPGAPGRIFLLNEDDIISRLQRLSDLTQGAFTWVETAGLKQVVRQYELYEEAAKVYLGMAYSEKLRNKSTGANNAG